VSEFAPEGRVDVIRTAVPVESRVSVPSDVVPLKNSTEPVGVPCPELSAATVAVSVTVCPEVDGFGDGESMVVDADVPVIVCVSASDVLAEKFVSPWYWAVIEFAPSARPVAAKVASPVLSSVPVPSTVAPFKNSTEPVGVPTPGPTALTVADSVTDCPCVAGLVELATVVAVDA
jgi:hypothetical protein